MSKLGVSIAILEINSDGLKILLVRLAAKGGAR